MLLESVEYTRPATVEEALEALASDDGAAPLAGGQSLINVLKNRVASVALLVDISRLDELRGVEARPDGSLEIGACVTYDELDRSAEVRRGHAILADVAGGIEDQQIRNRGTIGGNCCLSDPTNNLPPLLMALGATMNIQGRQGAREVPSDEFFHGYFATAVEQGEILRSITVPALGPDAGAGYSSLTIGGDSKAIVRASAYVRGDGTIEDVRGDGTIEDARVVLSVVGPRPIRHPGMEERLRGQPATAETVTHASEAVGEGDGLEPPTDSHGTADYRRRMARVVARRATHEAMARGGEGGE
jgi:aerobic carbon-monoxide dehydrogenase medium subunit